MEKEKIQDDREGDGGHCLVMLRKHRGILLVNDLGSHTRSLVVDLIIAQYSHHFVGHKCSSLITKCFNGVNLSSGRAVNTDEATLGNYNQL